MIQKFKKYLKKQGYGELSIRSTANMAGHFFIWLDSYELNAEELDYKTVLQFQAYLQERGQQRATVNNYMQAVRHYYDYLINEGICVINPAESIRMKGKVKKIQLNILSIEELEDLYFSCAIDEKNRMTNAFTLRDKVIVSLLVYQGIRPRQLTQLHLEHLHLDGGNIYIPRTARTNARNMNLEARQVLLFQEFLEEQRDYLFKLYKASPSDRLFPGDIHSMHRVVNRITKKLRRYNAKVKNANHLRASVIVNWLSQFNLRKVQYLAGHRYISSTEKYRAEDTQDLLEMVRGFHPVR